ncbi:arylamine N-acetyltransferase family protein [Nocardioides sp. GXQ0305]|uniref:arylamine N-acetyltransferase family protein n=1 Tax=Nocardioides sp. GXQ0305 TaxID=3423912 RepID=UPI003D7CDD22
MTTSTAGFDLDGYLARTGAAAAPPSTRALSGLLAAHVRTFPFDNIDVLLEQHPGVGLDAVADKFVRRGRGGYCFEHATLFHAVLQALGYDATLRLARVGDPDLAPRTHLGVVVVLDGRRWLADPGIGVPPLGPIPLEDGAELDGGIWPHRVVRVAEGETPGWQLWRRRSAGWELMHTTDELPVREVDVAMGHHWTSTSPITHFRSTFMLARHDLDDDGSAVQTSVTLDGVTERRAGVPSRNRPFDLAELPDLARRLGANLTDDETRRLEARLRALR